MNQKIKEQTFDFHMRFEYQDELNGETVPRDAVEDKKAVSRNEVLVLVKEALSDPNIVISFISIKDARV